MYHKIVAPDIDSTVSSCRNDRYGSGSFDYNDRTYDDKTYAMADLLFSLTEKLEPVNDDGARSLFLRAERREPEDWMTFRVWKQDNPHGRKKEYLEEWSDWFPDEYCWYRLTTYRFTKKGRTYEAIWLGGSMVFEYDDSRKKRDWPDSDISWILAWAVDAVHDAIHDLVRGAYNETVRRELPYTLRVGTITGKRLWDVFPELEKELKGPFSEKDLVEFDRCAREQNDDRPHITAGRIREMTANDFYRCCALGYKAMGYEGTDLSPKEQYLRNADGRDEGLSEIDPDSPEAFRDWLHDRTHSGGHPWEVCRGGNSTHIDLYVGDDDGEGYYLGLGGSSYGRTVEVVQFYLALHRAGLPVYLWDAKLIADRMRGDDIVGVVP